VIVSTNPLAENTFWGNPVKEKPPALADDSVPCAKTAKQRTSKMMVFIVWMKIF